MWNNILCVVILTVTIIFAYEKQGESNSDASVGVTSMKLNLDNNDEKLFDGIRRRGHHNSLRIRNEHPMFISSGPKGNLRIRGGNATDIKNYPYMAAIIINGRLWCAGTIVDINWVVTAAHCLNYVLHVSPLKNLGQFVKVRVGSARPHEGGTLIDVAGAVRHPKFEEEPVPHADVALLKLADNLEFHKYVNLLKIYEGIKEPFAQSFIVVNGWGATRRYTRHPDVRMAGVPSFRHRFVDEQGSDTAFRDHTPDLMTSRLKVRSQHYCVDAYQLVNGLQFTPDFFCASLRNGTRDACLFDAGAPAVQQNRLMGIMSFGPERCGHEYQPAVFVKAFYFRDFVKSTISSYKTTSELIDAIQEVDPAVPAMAVHEEAAEDQAEAQAGLDTATVPDNRHD